MTSPIRKSANLPPVPVVRAGTVAVADVATCVALPVMPCHQDSLIKIPVSLPQKKPVSSLYNAKVNPPPIGLSETLSAFGRTKELK